MNAISVAEKGAIMGAAVLQIFTLCGLYLVLLLMLLYMCGLFNERSVSRGAAFTAFATGRYFMINDRSMCLEDGACMVGVDDRLYLKSYTPIIPLRYFTGKTIIYKILGEIVGCGFTSYMHIVEKNDLTVNTKITRK